MTAGHPSLNPKIIAAPIIPKGKIATVNAREILNYIKLKSFDSMFVTFPKSQAFAMYWDNEDNFANKTSIKAALIFAPIKGLKYRPLWRLIWLQKYVNPPKKA